MPLPPPPKDLLAQIKSKSGDNDATAAPKRPGKLAGAIDPSLMAAIQGRQAAAATTTNSSIAKAPKPNAMANNAAAKETAPTIPPGKLFVYNESNSSFHFDLASDEGTTARLAPDVHDNPNVDIIVPLAPCVYRMTDYTFTKKEPIELKRCVNKLGVLRCLERECGVLNKLLWSRIHPHGGAVPALPDLLRNTIGGEQQPSGRGGGTIEEDELGKARFMELLSNCGVYQKVSEMILMQCNKASDNVSKNDTTKEGNAQNNPFRIPQIRVVGLSEFLSTIEVLCPELDAAREEINNSSTVSFHPGLGELFYPGSSLVCFPEGMEGTPLGVRCVQSWYDEELNRATNKVKRKFVLVVEFLVSVGEELVFVAASEVYPEFHDAGRSVPLRDLNHRRLSPLESEEDAILLKRMQSRGEFYASVATDNHYLEYHPNSFFPIIGGWGNNAVRPLTKSGRVMVDVSRGALAGHVPIRGTSDGMSDTVKEAMRLFDQSKRTGVAVPFRTAILPEKFRNHRSSKSKSKMGNPPSYYRGEEEYSDASQLWMAWPMLTGFSFTARCWGKLLLSLPKPPSSSSLETALGDMTIRRSGSDSPTRPSFKKMGVELAALGGVGRCGNVNYINFHEKAFDQLVLADEKKELIRAVARNAGGGSKFDFENDDFDDEDDDDEEDEIGLDVVANKGAASIFLLSGPPGCGKTLTAEAIAELLKKPLYVVTAGDLGITAAEVEKNLGGVLDLCSTWDALVLVDEADIFLETRSSTEIERNALVCVMLRLLEYYSGCLFLSSNRDANSIDAAIASRITVMLTYPPLDIEGRAKVWKNLIELVPTCPNNDRKQKIINNPRKISKYRMDFTEVEYQALASGYSLNGRQIKNAIVLARSLARERGLPLSMEILKRAVTAVAGDGASVSDSSSNYAAC